MTARGRKPAAPKESDHWFSWAWRPAMSWMIIFLFLWSTVLVPFLNGLFGTAIPIIAPADLTAFAGIWMVVYSGGHTLKSILTK